MANIMLLMNRSVLIVETSNSKRLARSQALEASGEARDRSRPTPLDTFGDLLIEDSWNVIHSNLISEDIACNSNLLHQVSV